MTTGARLSSYRTQPLGLCREHIAGRHVAGVDEVGRGPLAGPVVAAAVVLPDTDAEGGGLPDGVWQRIDDSKRVPRPTREWLAAALSGSAMVATGLATVAEIDRINIRNASLLAMARAVRNLPIAVDGALVDGNACPELACPCVAVIGGDARCLAIAAASIIAKVERDRIMAELDRLHPGYDWARNQGYPTPGHLAALTRLGASPAHRLSFAPVARRIRQDGMA